MRFDNGKADIRDEEVRPGQRPYSVGDMCPGTGKEQPMQAAVCRRIT